MRLRSVRTVRRFALGIVLALVVAACGTTSTPTLYALTVTVGGTGDGTVTSAPAGIDTAVAGGNQADFEDGTAVTLTASAAAGSTFTGWGGACASAVGTTCAVTVDAAKTATATFDEVVFALSVTVDGTGSGSVTSSPSGIDTSVAGGDEAEFAEGSVVTLTATADAGSKLLGWGGACATAVGTVCDVTMNADRNAFATFEPLEGTLELTITGLPLGVDADVRVTGPDGYDETFTTDASVTVPPGDYTVTPNPVSDAPAIYRAQGAVVTVVDDATTSETVTYDQPTALFFEDGLWSGDPYIETALVDAGFDVTVAAGAAAFDLQLAGGDVDLAIVLDQASGPIDVDTAGLQTFVDGGGALIGHSWGQVTAFGDVFEATFTGETNQTTTLVTATLAPPELSSGLVNPIDLVNPSTSGAYIYTTGLSPAGAEAVSTCTFENSDSCMVVSHGGSTALLGFAGDSVPLADGPTFWQNVSLFVLGY